MRPIQTIPGEAIATAATLIHHRRVCTALETVLAESRRRRVLRPTRLKPKRYKPARVKRPSLKVSHIGRRRRS